MEENHNFDEEFNQTANAVLDERDHDELQPDELDKDEDVVTKVLKHVSVLGKVANILEEETDTCKTNPPTLGSEPSEGDEEGQEEKN